MAESNYGMILETVPPAEMGAALAADAGNKAKFGTIHLLIRSFLCTPFLAYGAWVVFAMVAAGVPLGAAGLVFPAGYVTLNFLGRGLRPVIAESLIAEIPLVIGVSTQNLCDFLSFVRDSAKRRRPDIEAMTAWCRNAIEREAHHRFQPRPSSVHA